MEELLFEVGKTYKVVVKRTDENFGIYTLTIIGETTDFVEATDKYGVAKKIAKSAIIETALLVD